MALGVLAIACVRSVHAEHLRRYSHCRGPGSTALRLPKHPEQNPSKFPPFVDKASSGRTTRRNSSSSLTISEGPGRRPVGLYFCEGGTATGNDNRCYLLLCVKEFGTASFCFVRSNLSHQSTPTTGLCTSPYRGRQMRGVLALTR